MYRADGPRLSSIRIHCSRSVQRRREFAAALMAGDGRSTPWDCLIRDLSPDGAQIRLGAHLAVPDMAFLINLRGHLAYHAHIVWRRGSRMGLHFDKSYVINKLLPEDLHFLLGLLNAAKARPAANWLAPGMEARRGLNPPPTISP